MVLSNIDHIVGIYNNTEKQGTVQKEQVKLYMYMRQLVLCFTLIMEEFGWAPCLYPSNSICPLHQLIRWIGKDKNYGTDEIRRPTWSELNVTVNFVAWNIFSVGVLLHVLWMLVHCTVTYSSIYVAYATH